MDYFSLSSLPSFPALPSLPSLPSLPALPSLSTLSSFVYPEEKTLTINDFPELSKIFNCQYITINSKEYLFTTEELLKDKTLPDKMKKKLSPCDNLRKILQQNNIRYYNEYSIDSNKIFIPLDGIANETIDTSAIAVNSRELLTSSNNYQTVLLSPVFVKVEGQTRMYNIFLSKENQAIYQLYVKGKGKFEVQINDQSLFTEEIDSEHYSEVLYNHIRFIPSSVTLITKNKMSFLYTICKLNDQDRDANGFFHLSIYNSYEFDKCTILIKNSKVYFPKPF